jgi:hypothetical protein
MIRGTVLALALLGLGYVALAMFRPAWASAVGLDVWNLEDEERERTAAERRGAELEEIDRAIQENIAAKDGVIDDLLAERLTLLEAAALFRRLDAVCPGRSTIPERIPGRTEEERYCRQVIYWVEATTRYWPPSQAAAIRNRLEAELSAHQASYDGAVLLSRRESQEPVRPAECLGERHE